MNERILKLAKKSGATVNEGFDGNKNFVYGITMSPEELEKFAELIVRECAALAKSKSEHIEGIETEDHDDQIQLHSLAWQFKEFGYEIKKHFGVEE
jgi:hypothetical protein